MRTFEAYAYYEMLKVPVNAGLDDIKDAYRAALTVYDVDSLVTYSLFSEERRSEMLRTIKEAFATLSVQSKREAYNQELVNSGRAKIADFSAAGQKPHAGVCRGRAESKAGNLCVWVKKKSMERE